MSQETILQLLSSAEQCYERGRHRMAKMALGEIWDYIERDVEVDDATYDRIRALDEHYEDDPEYQAASVDVDETGNRPCPKCNGTGKYKGNGRVCFACKGKKFQDAADRARNDSYWAHRDKLRELRKAAVPSDL